MVTLDQIRDPAAGESFPCARLAKCKDGLVLFAAAFHGRQDAYWLAQAGMTATCVDIDRAKLDVMQKAYPDGWEFIEADVWDYVGTTPRLWDVVTVDCPSNLFERCAERVSAWCFHARRMVVLGTGKDTQIEAPSGWQITDRRYRSAFVGGVYWTVLERA